MTVNPDSLLSSIRWATREIQHRINNGSELPIDYDVADTLVSSIAALDTWIYKGGELPESWRRMNVCIGCFPEGVSETDAVVHEAHLEVWQVGNRWVPACTDRVLDWWHSDSAESIQERKAAGAPDQWIRPLQ